MSFCGIETLYHTGHRGSQGNPQILRSDDFAQGDQQAIHFFDGVVVHEADAQKAAGFFYVEVLGEV